MDRCIYAGGWSYWPGFFAQDVMRASAYKHINATSRTTNPEELHLMIIDRKDKRGFDLHGKWQSILQKNYPVVELNPLIIRQSLLFTILWIIYLFETKFYCFIMLISFYPHMVAH